MESTRLNFQIEFQERRDILSKNSVAKRRESDLEPGKMELKKLKSKNGIVKNVRNQQLNNFQASSNELERAKGQNAHFSDSPAVQWSL